MSYASDAADQAVRLSLNGLEIAAKITGEGAQRLAALLYTIIKDQSMNSKGKKSLRSMLKSGKELKVFAVRDDELKKFCNEAKKYGVSFCVLKDKEINDGTTDIMVYAEDASKINRIFERYGLSTIGKAPAAVEPDKEESKEEKKNEKEGKKENPTRAETVKSGQSEPSSTHSTKSGMTASDGKESVLAQLREIIEERKNTPTKTPHRKNKSMEI